MSFSRSFVRIPPALLAAHIRDQIGPAQAEADATLPEGCAKGHAKQIEAAAAAADVLAQLAPEGATVTGSVYGHATDDGNGNAGISYTFEPFEATENFKLAD